jgi:uncharacterized iron-regulated membrane protein
LEKLRTTHRVAGIIILTVLIYLSVTGLMIQSIDLRLVFMHKQQVDPDIRALLERQGGEFSILTAADKSAEALPANLDMNAKLQKILQSARTTLGDAPMRYVEFRMLNGTLVGNVQTQQQRASFDGTTGALLEQAQVPPLDPVTPLDALRYRIKEFHRMTIFGNWALWINIIVGLALIVMVITGVNLYFRMLRERKDQGCSGLFWVGGTGKQDDWKRSMHRGVGLSAAVFLLVIAGSGEWLAYESLVFGFRMDRAMQQRRASTGQNGTGNNAAGPNGAPPNGARTTGPGGIQSQLLNDANIPGMLQMTLNKEQQAANGAPLKVIRIRDFGGVPQGVVVTGDGRDTKQVVFNARTGELETNEPQRNGPRFPFGWDAHQTAKAVHRGSYFGVGARFLDFFAGLALLYLSINGLALYVDFRKERKQTRQSVTVIS